MRHLLALLLTVAIVGFSVAAADEPPATDNLDLSVAENIATPAVPAKAKPYIKGAMDQLRRYFIKDGFDCAMLRDGEVLRVTVPCSRLFPACDTELKPSAASVLKPFAMVVREPGKYKMLITVHTDDTGDDMYADSITATRANAIDDYLWQLAREQETNVVPYGLGRDEPLVPNKSMAGRATNRRVEFIIVPDTELLRQSGVKIK